MATTQLSFTQTDGQWVATADVTENFALHLECDEPSDFIVLQQSDPNATRPALNHKFNGLTELDIQMSVLLPATITIRSTKPVTYGSITVE